MRSNPFPSVLVALAACGGCLQPGVMGGDSDDVVEQVVLSLAVVPDDVGCVRLTATGPGRAVVRELDVSPGASLSQSYSGLPLGTVEFRAEAFGTACAPVTTATVPTWISEPVVTTVALGRIASVALTLHRNGRAKLAVDFADEPACSPAGALCRTSTECCSRVCAGGRCAAIDGGAADAQSD